MLSYEDTQIFHFSLAQEQLCDTLYTKCVYFAFVFYL